MFRVLSKAKENRQYRRPNWPKVVLALAVAFFAAPRLLFAATFTSSLDRDTIALGESAALALKFEGGNPENVPSLQSIPNLQIAYNGASQEFTVVNGQSSSSVTYNFTLTPSQVGDYTIPALTVEFSGQKLASQPLMLKVLKPNTPPPDAINSGSQLAFLKLQLPKKQVYAGETITGQLQVYLHSRVQGINGFQLTPIPADGFTVGKMVQGQRRQVRIGNAVYVIIPIDVALRAVKAGPLSVGPVTVSLVLELPASTRQRDAFDPFGFFNRNEQKQVSLTTETESLQGLPLPREKSPPDFNGAIGNFTMTLSAGPTNVAAGDPITVKIQIAGHGSLDSLTLPDQPAWHDFKTYPPTTKLETTDSLGLQGTKTFEQIVTPQNADIKALPAVSFSFFDPDQKSFRTLTQPAVPLTVTPGGSAPVPTIAATSRRSQENLPPPQDILPNKQRLGALAQIGPPMLQQRWFLALQGLPLLAFLSALIWRRRADNLANNPRLRRQRQVAQIVRTGLEQLRGFAAEKKSDDFFATLFRLIQEQLGERLDVPASAITEAVVEERLRPRGVAEATLVGLQELFQACNLARYAPIKSSQELAAIIPKVETALLELQRLKL
jgi:hypothetical protein